MTAPDEATDTRSFLTCPLAELTQAVREGEHTGWDNAVVLRLVDEIPDLAALRKAERERLAAWFEAHADALRGFTDGNLSVEFVAFLLRLAGE